MDAHSNKLSIIVNAPSLASGDGRPLAIVHGMERALPAFRLGWTLSEKGDLVELPDRDGWVAAERTDGGFPFVCNDDDNRPVTLFGLENPNGLYTAGGPHFEVHVALPLDAVGIAPAADVLKAIGEALAHSGGMRRRSAWAPSFRGRRSIQCANRDSRHGGCLRSGSQTPSARLRFRIAWGG